LLAAYGGTSPHHRSHGQSFLDLLVHRFRPGGLYLLDEPEAALSTRGCLAALARMHDLAQHGSQLLVATHSPVLLAVPGARILEIDEDGTIEPVDFDDALPVRATRRFLADPAATVREVLG
jgi:predicted ATPase